MVGKNTSHDISINMGATGHIDLLSDTGSADARVMPPGPMSLAIVVIKRNKEHQQVFTAKQGRVSTHQGQVSTGYCFQVKITHSP